MAVNGRPADIDSDPSGMIRAKDLFFSAEGIG